MDRAPEVSEPETSPRETTPTPPQRGASAAFFALAAVFLAAMSFRALSMSEARYAEAGREMAETGDWVVPHLSFVPYFEKPILAYWAQAASQTVFGLSPLSARLPSIAACLVMLWVTYALGRDLRGPRFGLGAAALLACAAMFATVGTSVMTDPLFAAFLAIAWYAFFRHDRNPEGRWIWAFWTALGFAVLTKGPLGAALAGMTVGAYILPRCRWQDIRALRPIAGLGVILAVNLPWSVMVWARDPRFLEFFYVRQNLKAFASGEINHPGPPWYYLPILVAAFFPFALLVAWAVGAETWAAVRDALRRGVAGMRENLTPDAGRLYLVCMLVPPLVLLSIAGSKLGTYVLPLLPAVALLAAGHVADRIANPSRVMRFATPALLVLLVGGAIYGLRRLAEDPEAEAVVTAHRGAVVAAAALFAAGFLAGSWLTVRGSIVRGLAVLGVAVCAGMLCVLPVADALQAQNGVEDLVEEMQRVRAPDNRVVLAGTCSQDYDVSLRLRERTYIWGNARELGMGHFAEVTPPETPIPDSPYDVCAANLPQNAWLVSDRRLAEWWRGAGRVWFIGRPKDVEKLRKMGLAVHVLGENTDRSIATNLALPAR